MQSKFVDICVDRLCVVARTELTDLARHCDWEQVTQLCASFIVRENGDEMPNLLSHCENKVKQSIYVEVATLCLANCTQST